MASGAFSYFVILLFTIRTSESYSDGANSVSTLGRIINSDFFEEFANQYLEGDEQKKEKTPCENQLQQIYEGIKNHEEWALELFDSWGKMPSGILWYHFASLGNYEQCVNISKEFKSAEKLHGKYCLGVIPLDEILKLIPKPPKPQEKMLMSGGGKMGLQIGLCIPDKCSTKEINDALDNVMKQFSNISLQTVLSEENCYVDTPIKFRPVDWIAIAVFSCVGILILTSSIYEFIIRSKGGHANEILLSFSILYNGSKIFRMERTNSPDVIECLHGIRSLSIIWVVFGHIYAVMAIGTPINMKYGVKWLKTVRSMFLQSATVSVDSFFLMSGLLVGWIILKELQKSQGRINVPLLYFHRYLRLTPVLAASILFSVSIVNYIGSGPFWNYINLFLVAPCEEYWWSALLYVQNYVNPKKFCLGHTWYLAVDTQLFLISPLIMFCLWKWGAKFIPAILVLMFSSIAYTFVTVYKNEYSLLFTEQAIGNDTRMETVYYPTHTRLSPWCIGVLLAYYLHNIKGRRIHLSKLNVAGLWLSIIVVIAAIIFGPYPKTQPDAVSYPIESAFYESFSRVSWSIALALLILLCYTGYGGIINSMLSLPFWQPISRLSYSIYMTHLIVTTVISAAIKTDTHFSDFDAIHRFWGDFAFTFMSSVVLSLAFESPIVGIERILFKRRKPTPSRENLHITNESETNKIGTNNA